MTICVRPAMINDANSLAKLIRDLGLFDHINSEPPQATIESVTRNLEMCLSDNSHIVYVACNALDEVVGYISIHWFPYLMQKAPEAYISELFIQDVQRGNGIGKLLLDTAKKLAKQRGCVRMRLVNLRMRESYARQFYAKNGWQEHSDAVNFVFSLHGQ